MLYGRSEERALIHELLARARKGRGGALVIHGEAGVGKGVLLRDAAEGACDMRVLRGSGVQSEVELFFAALHQLVQPVLNRLDRLPAPQASALRGAFGLADVEPDRFLIELGVLSMLTEVAREQPLLCLVADAQWLDRASADTLAFVARRLETEPIALLVAARDDTVHQFHAPGLPELSLGGLDAGAAARLLEAQVDKIAPEVRDRLIEDSRGYPLALLELPRILSGDQLAGREPLPERLPLGTTLQEVFLHRVRRLPQPTQTLLLVAAAEDSGELATVLAAGRALGADPEVLGPAEAAQLVYVIAPRLRFRHPLVRAAIYQGATFAARRAVHRALTEVLVGAQQADQRAWHLAAAVIGMDEHAARELESSGDRARQRGGPAAAAAALERAAALTPQTEPRARRLAAAAGHLWDAGRGERAQALLDQIQPPPADPGVHALVAHLRGAIELAVGTPATAYTLLVGGARMILGSDPERAAAMLAMATWAALAAGDVGRVIDEIGPAASRLPGQHHQITRVVESLVALRLGQAPPAAATATTVDAPPSPATTWPHPAFTWMWPMLVLAEPTDDGLTADQQYAASVAARRASGTFSELTVALANLAVAEASLGRWPDAVRNASEGLVLARETGQAAMAGYFLATLAGIAAHQGRAEDCRRLADEALAVAAPRRLAVVAALASWTLALLDLTQGRPHAALERLRTLSTPQHPTAHAPIALLATSTLLEAATRADALEGMEPFVARFERWADWDRRAWTSARAPRWRGPDQRGR